MNPINLKQDNIEVPQEMSSVALERMKELQPHLETAKIDLHKSEAGLLEKQREVFKSGVTQLSQASGVKQTTIGSVSGQTKLVAGLTPQEQLQRLVNLAFQEDPIVASRVASGLNDPFVEDRLDDILIEYHERLKRGGKLEEL